MLGGRPVLAEDDDAAAAARETIARMGAREETCAEQEPEQDHGGVAAAAAGGNGDEDGGRLRPRLVRPEPMLLSGSNRKRRRGDGPAEGDGAETGPAVVHLLERARLAWLGGSGDGDAAAKRARGEEYEA
jgi:hypothetical protein